LIFNVVELRCFSGADFVSIAQKFWMFGVVVAHREAFSEQLSENRECSKGRDQGNLERVPK
jgi:hypothetical protein